MGVWFSESPHFLFSAIFGGQKIRKILKSGLWSTINVNLAYENKKKYIQRIIFHTQTLLDLLKHQRSALSNKQWWIKHTHTKKTFPRCFFVCGRWIFLRALLSAHADGDNGSLLLRDASENCWCLLGCSTLLYMLRWNLFCLRWRRRVVISLLPAGSFDTMEVVSLVWPGTLAFCRWGCWVSPHSPLALYSSPLISILLKASLTRAYACVWCKILWNSIKICLNIEGALERTGSTLLRSRPKG